MNLTWTDRSQMQIFLSKMTFFCLAFWIFSRLKITGERNAFSRSKYPGKKSKTFLYTREDKRVVEVETIWLSEPNNFNVEAEH